VSAVPSLEGQNQSTPARSPDDVNPVGLALIHGALVDVQAEMTSTLVHSRRGAPMVDARESISALFDASPDLVLHGDSRPYHVAALSPAVRAVAAYFAGRLHEGDIYYLNDPTYGGSRLTDLTAYMPVFISGEIAFWVVSTMCVSDAGGLVGSGVYADARDLYAGGLRIPPLKLVERGELRDDVLNLILLNVRNRVEQEPDIRTQITAMRTAARRLSVVCARFGVAQVRAVCEHVKSLAEHYLRRAIAETPDGITTASVTIEDTGHGRGDLTITASAVIQGDRLRIALASPPQLAQGLNAYQSNTLAGAYFGVALWARFEPPYNDGFFRSIDVDCGPKGALLNAVGPAPQASATAIPSENVVEAVRAALTAAGGRRKMAQWGQTHVLQVNGIEPGTQASFGLPYVGALLSGGAAIEGQCDGWHTIGPVGAAGALLCRDTEDIESRYPLIVHEHGLRRDSAGPGQWRGGCGNVLTFETRAEVSILTVGQGMKDPARGVDGAFSLLPDSKRSRCFVQHVDGSVHDIVGTRSRQLAVGDRCTHCSAGGGGAGAPWDRPPELVAEDFRNGLVSGEAARVEYQVILDEVTGTVDPTATAVARRERPSRN
jgi:N-methylhydantoinase B